jgi:hypothetical protein
MKPERTRVVAEGLVTGLIGYVTVVLLFMVVNLFAGRPVFYTAGVLGSVLFFGVRDPAQAVLGPGPVIAYNGIHMLVSMAIGLGAAWLVFQAEKHRPLWYVVFFIFLAGFIYSVVVMGVFAAEIVHVLSWPTIVLANVAAGVAAGWYLWWRHSRILTDVWQEA